MKTLSITVLFLTAGWACLTDLTSTQAEADSWFAACLALAAGLAGLRWSREINRWIVKDL